MNDGPLSVTRKGAFGSGPHNRSASSRAKTEFREALAPQLHTITLADTRIPLIFEGPSVSPELKAQIVADLKLNLSHRHKVEFKELSARSLKPTSANRKYDRIVTHILCDRNDHLVKQPPEALKEYLGGAVKIEGRWHLIIHKAFVEAYRKKLDLIKQHPDALDKLREFLAQSPRRIQAPSLLDFTTVREITGKNSDEDALVATPLITWSRGDKESVGRLPPFIFVEGRWRIVAFRMP